MGIEKPRKRAAFAVDRDENAAVVRLADGRSGKTVVNAHCRRVPAQAARGATEKSESSGVSIVNRLKN